MMMNALDYLKELRRRLLRCVLCVSLLFVGLSFFSNALYHCLAQPLLAYLPSGHGLIATSVTAPFLVPFKFAFVTAIALSMPFLLSQLYLFIAPGLYRSERRLFAPLVAVSSVLFYVGLAFAYFIVFPLVFRFFAATVPAGVELRPDISQYLDFSLKLLFAFGITFEIPVITLLLLKTGFVQLAQLQRHRPYVIVLAFVLGMLLTPPDVVSQVMLAVPMWLLFELGLFLFKWLGASITLDQTERQP